MKKTMRLSVLAMGIAVLGAHGYSNPIEGGSTETVTNQWNVVMPWFMVGGNSSSNTLLVADGGRVESQIGIIGNNATSIENKVFVSGSNAVWNSSMEIAVGNEGSENTLGIYGGGRVDTANAYIGKISSNNFASISGSGSELLASSLHVGHTGSDNALGVFDGGRVSSVDGTIGHWVGSDDNSVLVMGTNSVWNNTGVLNVGEHGSDNLLLVVDGGTVQSPVVNLGVQSTSSNNTISVWGDGALLDAPELNIGGSTAGADGTGNRVSVRDGGTVATTDLNIYAGNRFDLNDGGRLAVSTNFNASMTGFNFNAGGTLEVGGELTGMGSRIEDQRTVVINGSNAVWNNGYYNLLIGEAGSALIVSNGANLISGPVKIASGGSSFLVAGTGSIADLGVWDLRIEGDGSDLIITEGGVVFSGKGYVGSSTSSGSRALVHGSGSVWSNKYDLYVGYFGASNTLQVSEGGRVYNRNSYIGRSQHVRGNVVDISGGGTKWINSGVISLGDSGSGNTVRVTDGAQVSSRTSYIGHLGSENTVLVDGAESRFETEEQLYIGYQGDRNSLTITNGGQMQNTDAYIGYQGIADNNSVLVSGAGSVWDNSGDLNVGYNGSGNTVWIKDGARVNSWNGFIGYGVGYGGNTADSNSVFVTGNDSVWHNQKTLYLGGHKSGTNWVNGGTGNSLTVTNGGWVFVGDVAMNNLPNIRNGGAIAVGDASGNPELVAANGSTIRTAYGYVGLGRNETGSLVLLDRGTELDVRNNLHVGYEGSSNSMEVANGATARSYAGYIGYMEGADGNSVTVSGTGSVWSTRGENAGYFYVGRAGASNTLSITDGGVVDSDGAYIGYFEDSNGNSAEVRGAGSVWNSRENMYVGLKGSSNVLTITSGGQVFSELGGIGSYETASDNLALVTGGGSVWSNRGNFYVGSTGSRNHLMIEDGGQVHNGVGFLGLSPSGSSNSVTVSGAGSVWNNRDDLYIGRASVGNSMMVADGGAVHNQAGYLGQFKDTDNGSVSVTGDGSLWHNHEALYLGGRKSGINWIDGGTGNSLTVSNGGWVLVGDVGTNNLPNLGTGGGIVVGDASGSPEMVVANGSKVEDSWGYIGLGTGESGSVAVSGEGSVWDNSGQLRVGHNGSGNTLRIEDGGHVHAQWGSSIGYGEGADGNSLVVSGEDSVLSSGWHIFSISAPGIIDRLGFTNSAPIIGGPPYIGFPLPTNSYPVYVGGGLVVDGGGVMIGSNDPGNVLTITDGSFAGSGSLVDSALTNNYISVVDGGRVWSGDNSLVLTNEAISITNVPPIQMEPIVVMATLGELSVGRGGSGNSLLVEDGAQVVSMAAVIGETSNAWSNSVSVVGTNSEWRNTGDLYIGGRMADYVLGWNTLEARMESGWLDGGHGNSLYVADGGLVSVGRDMHNRNYSTVSIDPGGHISVSSNYYQDATSVLRFGVETNAVGAPLNALVSVGGTAEFETGATLQYHSNVGLLDFDTFYTNLIVEADTLVVGGVTNANALDLEAINLDGSLVDVLLWEQDQDIYGLVGRKYLADSAGFTEGSMMARLSKEIDDLSLLGNPGAVAQINLLNGMSAEQQNQQLTQLYTQGVPTYQHQQGVQGGQKQVLAQSRGFQSGNRSEGAKPEGAAGPHEADQGLRGWMRGYGNWAEREESGSFSDFSQNAYGTVVGLDRSFGSVLLGAAGGYAYSDLTQENRDSSNAKTGFGVLYGSFGSTDWFGDLNFSYGRSRIETRSGTLFGAKGTSDADNYSVYLGGGKEISLADGEYLFTPEAALLVDYFDQEGYSDGLRDIDAYDRWSYQSRLGASIAFPRKTDSVVWKPEARIYWLHEFNADFDQVGYSLVGGSGRYVFGVQAPVEDLIEAGVGLSATFNDRLEIVFDVDGQYSGDYEAITVSGRVIYEF